MSARAGRLPLVDPGQQVRQVGQPDRQRLALAELPLDHQGLLEQLPGPAQVAVVHLEQGHVVERGGQGAAVTMGCPQFHGRGEAAPGRGPVAQVAVGRAEHGGRGRGRAPARPAAPGCAAPAGPGGPPRRSHRSPRPAPRPSRTRARPARRAAGPPGPAPSPARPGRSSAGRGAATSATTPRPYPGRPGCRPDPLTIPAPDPGRRWRPSSRAIHSPASGPARPVSLSWASAAKYCACRCRTAVRRAGLRQPRRGERAHRVEHAEPVVLACPG